MVNRKSGYATPQEKQIKDHRPSELIAVRGHTYIHLPLGYRFNIKPKEGFTFEYKKGCLWAVYADGDRFQVLTDHLPDKHRLPILAPYQRLEIA